MCLQPVGGGLSVESARELGLQPGIPVGTSLIDAHAGSMYENVCWQIFVCNTSKCMQATPRHEIDCKFVEQNLVTI